ncbi:MAG: hypothetical protein IJQ01_03045 [Selenomonadaceae bacterium]|nr:hypothetical protein [Selenomonadaceae bacterium]
MATREENIKKINDALEKLSDEELDNVAGGFYARYARYNGGEFEKDQAVNIENKNKIIHVTA